MAAAHPCSAGWSFRSSLSAALAAQSPQTAPGLQTLEVVPLPRDGEVLVSFKLNETLTDEIRKAIQSGLTIKFVYKVDLRRSSSVWVDRTLAIGARWPRRFATTR